MSDDKLWDNAFSHAEAVIGLSRSDNVGGLVELLPCPFCGGTDIGDEHVVTYSVDSSYDTFGCRTCGARFENGNSSKWNTRVSAHGQPVVGEAWLRQAIEEFKYLSGRTDLPMQDRERWRALNVALTGATP